MRRISRHILIGLLVAAAAASVGSVTHIVAAPARHSSVSMSSQTCPQGTNWNNNTCT